MFKKPFVLRARSAYRDKRQLRRDLEAAFPSLAASGGAADEEEPDTKSVVAKLLAKQAFVEQLRVTTATGVLVNVYVSNGEPVAMHIDEREIVPTCQLLMRCPTALPPLLTHAAVLDILQGGADLMLPGLIFPKEGPAGLGTFERGQLRALWVRGYEAPVAIGRMAVSSTELASTSLGSMNERKKDQIERGGKGKAFLVLHIMGDHVWQLGPVAVPQGVANAYPAGESAETISEGEDDEDDEQIAEVIQAVVIAPEEQQEEKTPDELMEAAFLLALRSHVKDKDLPILASSFFANVLSLCKPLGQTVDVKKTTHKKSGKFLSAMETIGLVKLVDSKGVVSITAVNRQHEKLVSFRPNQWEEPTLASSSSSSSSAPSAKVPYISELFRVVSAFGPMMDEQGISRDKYFNFSELRAILNEYVTAHQLVNPANPRMVVLDPFLSDQLVARKDRSVTLELPRDQLAHEFIAKQTPFFRVSPPDGSEPTIK